MGQRIAISTCGLVPKDEATNNREPLAYSYCLVVYPANLQQAKLTKADFNGSMCWIANFTGANLKHASLRKTDLNSATLNNANLSSADLAEAILNNTQMLNADLTSANLLGASFTGLLRWNNNSKEDQEGLKRLLAEAKTLKNATLPDGRVWSD